MNNSAFTLFEKFIKENSLFKYDKLSKYRDSVLELLFIAQLFTESKKRRMNEGHKELLKDAALSLLYEYREDFTKYRIQSGQAFLPYYDDQYYEKLACEMVEQLSKRYSFKSMIVQWLWDYRKDIFTDTAYKQVIGDAEIEDHPMQTFVTWLDYIDNIKDVFEYQKLIGIKRNIINLMRVGNAILQRYEWATRAILIEEGKTN